MSRAGSLVGLRVPAPVYLRGRVASLDAVQSPISGTLAALIQYYLFVPGRPARSFFGSDVPDRLLETGLLGEALLIDTDGGRVRLDVGSNLDVYFAGANATAHPVAPETPWLAPRPDYQQLAASGELHHRELCIFTGQLVRLRAVVAPMQGSGQYRTGAEADFLVVATAEAPQLSVDVPELADS